MLLGIDTMDLQKMKGKGFLIHHWDTDGICSARLILEKLSDQIAANQTPTLGNYFLTNKEIQGITGFDFIIIADMSLPEENIQRLAEHAEVFIFDHHLGKVIPQVFHHNPIIKGEDPDEYPSASWIVNNFLGNPMNLHALLGIIGDHEQNIKNNQQFNQLITNFCTENNLPFDDLLRMVYLIDSNYKTGDKKAVELAPFFLLEHRKAEDILENEQWMRNLENLNIEIKSILNESIDTIDGILFKTMDTKSNIISTITRQIAWNNQQNTIVVNKGYFDEENQLYVRTINKDMKPMIQKGKEYGFKCGGKKEVLGAILPKQRTESFIDEIIGYLSKK